ncbi:MAG TPA: hypothetical protein VIY29_09420, partial [Ktedonobacteraceae bacterium]
MIVRPGKCKAGLHRLIIFFERLRKAAQFGGALLFDLFEPRIKAFSFALSQHRRKFLDQFIGFSNFLSGFAELGERLLLPLQALLFL